LNRNSQNFGQPGGSGATSWSNPTLASVPRTRPPTVTLQRALREKCHISSRPYWRQRGGSALTLANPSGQFHSCYLPSHFAILSSGGCPTRYISKEPTRLTPCSSTMIATA